MKLYLVTVGGDNEPIETRGVRLEARLASAFSGLSLK